MHYGPDICTLRTLDLLSLITILIAFMVAIAIAIFAAALRRYSSVISSVAWGYTNWSCLRSGRVFSYSALSIIFIILVNDMKDAANTCFDPETRVKTQSGELVAMKDLELNTILKNGTRVVSVMKINNIQMSR